MENFTIYKINKYSIPIELGIGILNRNPEEFIEQNLFSFQRRLPRVKFLNLEIMTINDFAGQPVQLTAKEELAYRLIETMKIATQSLMPSYEDIKAVVVLTEQIAKVEETSDSEEA